MNSKGIYSAVLGLAAIVLVSIILINASAAVQSETSADYGNEIVKLKTKMQNLRNLLDKAAEDVFCEQIMTLCERRIYRTDLDYGDAMEHKFIIGDDSVISRFNAEEPFIECELTRIQRDIENRQPFWARIECTKSIKKGPEDEIEFEVSYEKEFTFRKNANILGERRCNILVEDQFGGGDALNC